ncbi:MAG TPA: hypothetical protein HPP83_09080, partial [Candidatus Hydrogenedentes bacterium]|nr:hypothetical protein [Candidatus Hydrogenedentota bacterium]
MGLFCRRFPRSILMLALCFPFPSSPAAQTTGAKEAYSPASLDGQYSMHDLFARLDGGGLIRYGWRIYDGVGEVGHQEAVPWMFFTLAYDVDADGRLSYSEGAYTGSVGLDGRLAAHSRYAVKDEDAHLPSGYSGFRISVQRSPAEIDNAAFSGTYRYHALVALGNDNWRTIAGFVAADGAGEFTLTRGGLDTVDHTYAVQDNGMTVIDGQNGVFATIIPTGDVLFQTVDVGESRDPSIPEGYEGLAIYVRRGTGVTAEDFAGTYRIHEVRVQSDRAHVAGVGTVNASGNGVYNGTIER